MTEITTYDGFKGLGDHEKNRFFHNYLIKPSDRRYGYMVTDNGVSGCRFLETEAEAEKWLTNKQQQFSYFLKFRVKKYEIIPRYNESAIKNAMISEGWEYDARYPFCIDGETNLHYWNFRKVNRAYAAWKPTEGEAVIHAAAKALLGDGGAQKNAPAHKNKE